MKKSIIPFLLFIALLININMVMAAETTDISEVYNGESEDFTWNINSDGLLTIRGEGDGDHSRFSVVWTQQQADIIKAAEVSVTGITDMELMFSNCYNLSSITFNNCDISNVTNMYGMFEGCSSLTSVDVNGDWDTSNVMNMHGMFSGCSKLTNIDVSNWNTSNVTLMGYMFSGCSSLTNIDVGSSWDTSNVTLMHCMFSGCSSLTNIDVGSSWDTSSVTDMHEMFSGCSSLKNVDVSRWNISNVTDMFQMFLECRSLTNIEVSGWNTSNVKNMSEMFSGCSSLTSMDISGWKTSNVTYIQKIFLNCNSITQFVIPANFPTAITLYGSTWKNENGDVCTEIADNLPSPMTYKKYDNNIEISNFTLEESVQGLSNSPIEISGTISLKDGAIATKEEWADIIKNIVWNSDNLLVVENITCKQSGEADGTNSCMLLISIIGKENGTATITGTLTKGQKASCVVTVTEKENDKNISIFLNRNALTLTIGSSETLTATVFPVNASNQNVLWNSSNTAVATVTNTGLVRAISAGTAEITVRTEDGSCKAVCNVTVLKNSNTSTSGGSGTGTSDGTSKPSEPDTPNGSDTPGEPTAPDTPDTPDMPSTPDTPNEPANPENPAEPPETTIVENPDGSKTETTVSTEENKYGNVVQTTEVVNKDADGKITGSSIKSIISTGSQDGGASIIVNIEKNEKGTITNATAKISGTPSSETKDTLISGSMIKQIIEAAGINNIKVHIENKDGSRSYTVLANAVDLTAGKKLKIVMKQPNGAYVLVNASTYTVTKDGDVFASIKGNGTYEFINGSAMNKLSKKILQTVKVKNTSKTVRKSKTVKIALKNTLNMDNVKSIMYTVSKKSVASVTKKGIVRGKKAGSAVVKAKVTLKNGRTKTVKMKIKVKG